MKNVIFTGFINHSSISPYYEMADLFALISEYDNSPKSVNEAMNFSLPVLCTRNSGTAADLVFEGDNGFLVDCGDVERIAGVIETLAGDRSLARRMGQRSLEIVAKATFEKDVEGVLEALDSVNK